MKKPQYYDSLFTDYAVFYSTIISARRAIRAEMKGLAKQLS